MCAVDVLWVVGCGLGVCVVDVCVLWVYIVNGFCGLGECFVAVCVLWMCVDGCYGLWVLWVVGIVGCGHVVWGWVSCCVHTLMYVCLCGEGIEADSSNWAQGQEGRWHREVAGDTCSAWWCWRVQEAAWGKQHNGTDTGHEMTKK